MSFLKVSDFEKKVEFFNNHCASQCSLVKNASTVPNLETDELLNYCETNENDILSIIKNHNTCRAHEWDKISITMIKLCGKTVALPLKLILRSMLEEGVFPTTGKKQYSSNSQKRL